MKSDRRQRPANELLDYPPLNSYSIWDVGKWLVSRVAHSFSHKRWEPAPLLMTNAFSSFADVASLPGELFSVRYISNHFWRRNSKLLCTHGSSDGTDGFSCPPRTDRLHIRPLITQATALVAPLTLSWHRIEYFVQSVFYCTYSNCRTWGIWCQAIMTNTGHTTMTIAPLKDMIIRWLPWITIRKKVGRLASLGFLCVQGKRWLH